MCWLAVRCFDVLHCAFDMTHSGSLEDESHSKSNSSSSASLHRHMDSHHTQVNTQRQLHTSSYSMGVILDASHWWQQIYFVILSNTSGTQRPAYTHTNAHTPTPTRTYAQEPHYYIRPVFCFRFVYIQSSQESGLHWTPLISHDMWAFSCLVHRCKVTGLNFIFLRVCTEPQTHTCSDGEEHKHTLTLPMFAIDTALMTKWKPPVDERISKILRATMSWCTCSVTVKLKTYESLKPPHRQQVTT